MCKERLFVSTENVLIIEVSLFPSVLIEGLHYYNYTIRAHKCGLA